MNTEWVISTLDKLAEFNSGKQGVTRLAYSKEDVEAKEYFISLMKDVGLDVRIDDFGNIIGRLAGKDNTLPVVATGSHLDTVPEGGKYDGMLGVVGGLAAIKKIKDKGEVRHPLELIIFANEESSRFGYATMGSKVIIGKGNKNWLKATDKDGINFAEALEKLNFKLDIKKSIIPPEKFKGFVELHIEQGPVLDREDITIGIVETIAAPTRLKVNIEGQAGHSGATPMVGRRDALVSAAMIVLAVQEIATEHADYGTVGTVGVLNVSPGATNVIPGFVEMGIDIRGVNQESIIEALQELKDAISTIAETQDTPILMSVLASDKPVALNKDIQAIIEKTCEKLNVTYKRMPSGAGHDAMNMASITPSAMIFIPCKEGISHNPEEFAETDDIMQGIDVLTDVLYQMAK